MDIVYVAIYPLVISAKILQFLFFILNSIFNSYDLSFTSENHLENKINVQPEVDNKHKLEIIPTNKRQKCIIDENHKNTLDMFLSIHTQLVKKELRDMRFERTRFIGGCAGDPYMFTIEHSFTDKECDSMISQFEEESHLHYNGVTGGGYTPKTKRTREINISTTESWKEWNNICFDRLNKALTIYGLHCIQYCNNDLLLNTLQQPGQINDTGYQLQKYMKGEQYYKWHSDSGIKPLCRTKNKNQPEHRIITYLWYLNDVEQGGETYFYHGKYKPKKGTLLLFPAGWTYNHKGDTPMSDDKYIITGWVYGYI